MLSARDDMKIFSKKVDYFGCELTVPIWVNWLAMDKDGKLYGFKHEPSSDQGFWHIPSKGNDYIYITYVATEKNWTETKQKV